MRMSVAEYRALSAAERRVAHRGREEDALHVSCVEYLMLQEASYPILRYAIHVPNGGKRGKAEAGRFKAMGVKAGVPDIPLPLRNGRWAEWLMS